ncbi:hypothetical protein RF11_09055 [Thelohanellus kitauei]|uniref:Uncharacterized protein n=1 Tax=Thelohanellus kitauei TaxID=669202 RepID=A0A0C2N310_THEKT|nr:hypothetical protein RF11_09055 [Thelohanellus kitauei]
MLVHADLKSLTLLHRVSYVNFSNAMELTIQTNYSSSFVEYNKEILYPHGKTKCQFTCNPLIATEDFCYCSDDVEKAKIYICPNDDFTCLSELILLTRQILCRLHMQEPKMST